MRTKLFLTFILGFFIFFSCKKYEVVQKDSDNPDGINIVLMRAIHYGDSIVLLWSDDSPEREGFKIYRKSQPDGSFSQIAEVGKNTFRYADMTVQDTDSMFYYVQVYNNNFSANSNIVASNHSMVEPGNQPPAPEYILYDGQYGSYAIDYTGEKDVFSFITTLGDDMDIEIDNYSSFNDIAVKIWDSAGVYLGIYNITGPGGDEYIYNVGYAVPYIFEVYSYNNQTGSYYIYVY